MEKNTILIVDDEPEIITIYETALVKAGFIVKSAENGEEGVRLAREMHPALILMDVKMPVMSGIEAAGKLLSDPEMKGTRIVFLTAFSDASHLELDTQMVALQAQLKNMPAEPTFDTLTLETGFIQKGGSIEEFVKTVRTYMPSTT